MGSRKKKTSDEERPSGLIQVMTVSLFIILLAFFILLNAIAVVDESKKMKAFGSLLGSFGILPGGISAFKGKGRDVAPPTAPMESKQLDAETFVPLPTQDAIDMVAVKSEDKQDVVTIQEELLFNRGELQIKRSAFPILDGVCRIINRDNSNVEIAGHTDDNELEQGEDMGWKLSGLQAIAVARYFIEKGNVDPKTITAYGSSAYKPQVTNVTEETRKQNRRVDIHISPNAWRHISRIYKNRPNRVFTFKKFVFDLVD
ncbi:MAG: OmpA family protein [Pseudomonadota bacterium]